MNRIAAICACIAAIPMTLAAGEPCKHCQSMIVHESASCPTPCEMPTCPTCPPTSWSTCPTCPDQIGVTCPPWSKCDKLHCKHGLKGLGLPKCCMTWCIKTDICCWDNTCQMPPHYAYRPACHGHYYFAPYNYCTALKQKAHTRHNNFDPRFPYTVPVFDHVYGEIIGDREAEDVDEVVYEPTVRLPNLEELIQGK